MSALDLLFTKHRSIISNFLGILEVARLGYLSK
jgi:hypothetical protein